VPNNDKSKRRALIGFLIFTALSLAVILFAPWQRHADFDIIGILWIMQNIVPFTVLGVLVGGALGAGITWLRYKIREVRN